MSQVPLLQVNRPKTIQHFTHRAHPLTLIDDPRKFLCNGCELLGTGSIRYRCNTCDFDLHEACSECPPAGEHSSSFMHPQHQLLSAVRTQGAGNQPECDICGEVVNGLFLSCRICNFDVHPTCSKLPITLTHGVHPHHVLTLRPFDPLESRYCIVCSSLVYRDWNYGCTPCRIILHLNCATKPWPPQPQPESLPPQPQPQQVLPSGDDDGDDDDGNDDDDAAAPCRSRGSTSKRVALKIGLELACNVLGIPDISFFLDPFL